MAAKAAAAGPGVGREGGFVAVHRRLRSSPVFRSLSAPQRSVFLTILLLANWKEGRFLRGGAWIVVHRGELAHSLETIADEAAVSVKVVRTTLAKLMSDDSSTGGNGPFLTGRWTGTEPGRGLRVLRVEKYAEYQDVGGGRGTEPGTEPGTEGAREGHASGTEGAPIEPREPREPVEPCATDAAPPPSRVQDAGSPPAVLPASHKRKPDPRHQPLVEGLVADFQAARRVAYGFDGGKDARAVTRLLALGTAAVGSEGAVAEVRRRWGIALGLGARWPGCSSIAMLPARWNEVATAPPKLGPDGRPLKRYPKVHVPTEYS